MTKRPIDFRPPDLVTAILGFVLDDEDPTFSVPERELLEFLDTGAWKSTTIRRTLRELVDFGALRRLTPLRKEARIRLSALGRAWVDQRVEPWVRPLDDDDQDDDELEETDAPDPEVDLEPY